MVGRAGRKSSLRAWKRCGTSTILSRNFNLLRDYGCTVGLANQSCVRGSLRLVSTALHCVARKNLSPIARSVLGFASDINYLTRLQRIHGAIQRASLHPSQSIVFSHRAKTVYALSSTQKHVVCLWISAISWSDAVKWTARRNRGGWYLARWDRVSCCRKFYLRCDKHSTDNNYCTIWKIHHDSWLRIARCVCVWILKG